MHCPKCHGQMEVQKIENVEIDTCTKCSGVWFEQDEIKNAKDQTEPDLNWMDFEIWKNADKFEFSHKPMQCPKCKLDMVVIDYDKTNVEIDYCPICKGTWLDEGEFKKIIEALNCELANKSSSEYLSSTLKEGMEIVTGPESFMSEWKDFITVLRMFQYRFFILHPNLQDAVVNMQRSFPV